MHGPKKNADDPKRIDPNDRPKAPLSQQFVIVVSHRVYLTLRPRGFNTSTLRRLTRVTPRVGRRLIGRSNSYEPRLTTSAAIDVLDIA